MSSFFSPTVLVLALQRFSAKRFQDQILCFLNDAAAVSPERLWKTVRVPEGASVSPLRGCLKGPKRRLNVRSQGGVKGHIRSQTGLITELACVSNFQITC